MEWICANCAFKPVGYCKIARRSVNGNTPACPGFKRNDEDTIGFRNVWTLPLRMDDYSYAWDQNYVMALTFEDGKNEQGFNEMRRLAKEVVDAINGDAESTTRGRWTHETCDFYLDGEYKFCVRGWGHLTGTGGGMHLTPEAATRIQDEFINFIDQRING